MNEIAKEDESKILEDEIYSSILSGNNVLIHGIGGCGKTYTTKRILKRLLADKIDIGVTALTGIATLNLNDPDSLIMCSTLHKWTGIGLGESSVDSLLTRIHRNSRCKRNWKNTQILFIDEFSMLGKKLFEKLEEIAREMRNNDKPFGGIQIVGVGDCLQLQPINDSPIFTSEVWIDSMKFVPFYLYKPKRYDDANFFRLLSRVREGKCSPGDAKLLQERVEEFTLYKEKETKGLIKFKSTILYPKIVDVDAYNAQELEKLPSPEFSFEAKDNFTPFSKAVKADYYLTKLDDAIPKVIVLKKDALVMLKYNCDVERGLVNGARGIITDISDHRVIVKFTNGLEEKVDLVTWEFKDKEGKSSRTQIPFILAYASTIHKCQGLTLDSAIVDVGYDIFAQGQAYVALSRVRNIKSLLLSEFREKSIMVNKEALKYNNLLIKQEIKRRS